MTTATLPTRSTPDAAPHAPLAVPNAVDAALDRAARTVAPVWPLRHFVAVNPFLGLADRPFAEAVPTLARLAGARLTMPRAHYAAALREGRLTEADLAEALAEARRAPNGESLPATAAALRAIAEGPEGPSPEVMRLPTVADVVADATGHDWPTLVVERISAWAAAHWDEGQASWPSPWRHLPPYAAWRAEAALDRTPELHGIPGFRAAVRRLPEDASAAARAAVARLGLADAALGPYLQRLAMSVGGWAAWARQLLWQQELRGAADDVAMELVTVRLAWDAALLDAVEARGGALAARVRDGWTRAQAALAAPATVSPDQAIDLVLHAAYERAWERRLLGALPAPPAARAARPAVQAAFCIDVRSEIVRRALEQADPAIETIGFAGFFGFPIEYVPLGQTHGGAQCPVLLTPSVVIPEVVRGAEAAPRAGRARVVGRAAGRAWKAFKLGAISCFGFVGPVGLAFARKLVTDALGLTRPVAHPGADHLPDDVRARLAPSLAPGRLDGRAVGLEPEARAAMAEAVLRAMSLTGPFARLVLLAGHGATTVNNPHATGLDCGACGGHTGEANARVAALVLNDAGVRPALAARGIVVPDDTVFVAGLHDTTTDAVTLLDAETIPATHAADVARLRAALDAAARRARAERAPALGIAPGADVDALVRARTRDWAQVRPEWGLAGCAAFIAAPRHRTRGVDLGGRAFLHSYAWRDDAECAVLELIMTAPMVVASWISLQYYGSTVDNRAFGSGNKTLHNVVGTIGVLEGNGGDLRVGLPWQSVHDGTRFVHEPVRLHVVIEAPPEAMNGVLAKHPAVQALLDHGWLHLFAMDDAGVVSHRYAGARTWTPLHGATLDRAA